MLKDRKKVLILFVVIIIGIFVMLNVANKIKINKKFENIRNDYKKLVDEINMDDITDNTYIVSVSAKTDFDIKDSYDKYDTQYDMIEITVKLSDDFESMDIKQRCVVLRKIDEEIISILTNGKENTGYSTLLDDDYVSYKGSNINVIEESDIDFVSSSKIYTFDSGLFHGYDSIYIKGEDGKFGYIDYKIEWDENNIVSVKESEHSSNSYTPVEEDYNSLTYHEVTDDDTLSEVWTISQSFIKDQLKSPKSADFPTYRDSNVSITNSGDYYKVTGYVDAENSFGAEIRSTFSLVLKRSGSKYILNECNIY